MFLSPEQIETFNRDGVIPLGRVLTDEQVREARERLEKLVEQDKIDRPGIETGKYMIRRLNVSEFDPWFGTMVRLDTILDPAESILGPNVQFYQDNIFYKPAGVGGATLFHQDNIWWKGNPPAMITIWIALDLVDNTNGAVEYVRGSNARLIDHTLPVTDPNGTSYNMIAESSVDRSKVVSYTLHPGEAVMHHCLTIHGGPGNTSQRPRRGYTIHLMRYGVSPNDKEMLRGQMVAAAAQ